MTQAYRLELDAKLVARVEAGNARILSATVSEQAGRWFVSFTCAVDRPAAPVPPGAAVGVDVGVKHLAVLSTGEQVTNPEHLGRYQRCRARLQAELARRRGPGKGRQASRRWEQTKARMARTHRKVADARADSLRKLTTRLAKTHAVVVAEDLAVKNMTAAGSGRGRRGKAGLNRAILDVAPGVLRRQLATAISSGTASGAGTGQTPGLVYAQGDDKFMASARWSPTNCEGSTGQPGQTATAVEQSTAA